jgi:hypothetical protein
MKRVDGVVELVGCMYFPACNVKPVMLLKMNYCRVFDLSQKKQKLSVAP